MTKRLMSTLDFFRLMFEGLNGYTFITSWGPDAKYGDTAYGPTHVEGWFRVHPNAPRMTENSLRLMADFVRENADRDLYFSPYVFPKNNEEKPRERGNATQTRVIHADADSFHPSGFKVAPSMVWRTSPGRYQCVWLMDQQHEAQDPSLSGVARSVSMTHKDAGCDGGGWDAGQLLRIPGSTHNKYLTEKGRSEGYERPNRVRIISCTGEVFKVGDIAAQYPAMDVVRAQAASAVDRAKPKKRPNSYLQGLMSQSSGEIKTDRSTARTRFIKCAVEEGYADGEILYLLDSHTIVQEIMAEKSRDWDKLHLQQIAAHRSDHNHVSQTCKQAGCGNNVVPLRPGQGEAGVRQLQLRPFTEIKTRVTKWLWDTSPAGSKFTTQGRIALGTLTLAAGAPGTGKSMTASLIAAMVTKGTLPGEFFGQPRSVVYLATEDSYQETIKPRLLAAGADMSRVFLVEVTETHTERKRVSVMLPDDTESLGEECAASDVSLIIADPLMSFLTRRINENAAKEVRDALEPLVQMADKHRITLYGLAHFNKSDGTDPLARIANSGAFTQLARCAFAFAKLDEPEEGEPQKFVMSQIKNNLGPSVPNLEYHIETVVFEKSETAEDGDRKLVTTRIILGNETSVSVGDRLESASETPEKKTALGIAREFLLEEMTPGQPIARQNVLDKASMKDITSPTLYRAATSLGIIKDQVKKTWALPEKKKGK